MCPPSSGRPPLRPPSSAGMSSRTDNRTSDPAAYAARTSNGMAFPILDSGAS